MTPIDKLTPVELRDGIYFKREDLFDCFGVYGAKARQAYLLARNAKGGLVTGGSRISPQIKIVARIAKALGLPCYYFTLPGKETPEMASARLDGAIHITQTNWKHDNVADYHAKKFATEHNLFLIPFGMVCWPMVKNVSQQVANVPLNVKHIVIPVGSGTNLCGILWGLKNAGRTDVVVTGVRVGKNPKQTLARLAPKYPNFELVESPMDYHEKVKDTMFHGVALDPVYEAKCIPFVYKGDLLWVVGHR